MLLALAGLFGWLTILTLFWWISPPAIGPRGNNAVLDSRSRSYVNDGSSGRRPRSSASLVHPDDAAHRRARSSPRTPSSSRGVPERVHALRPRRPSTPTSSRPYLATPTPSTAGRSRASSSAGEAQAAADAALIDARHLHGHHRVQEAQRLRVRRQAHPRTSTAPTPRAAASSPTTRSAGSSTSSTSCSASATRRTTPSSRCSRSSPRRPSAGEAPPHPDRRRDASRSSRSCSCATSATCA